MKPAAFDYVLASTLAEALAAKARHGDDARFLAGGQSLVPTMNFRLAQPGLLIDINGLTDCAYINHGAGETRIGALTRYHALERDPALLARFPLLADALPLISHPQIRSRGTIGGNLAHADPASEMPAVMLALEARLRLACVNGERWVAAKDFFLGALTTALRDDEMLVEVAIPAPAPHTGMCFLETSRRKGDFAMAGVAAVVTMEGATCIAARVALCGVGDQALLAQQAEALIAHDLTDAMIAQVAVQIAAALDPPGSLQASGAYQRHLAGVLTERALIAARDRAMAQAEARTHAA